MTTKEQSKQASRKSRQQAKNEKGIRLDQKTGNYIIRWTYQVVEDGRRVRKDKEKVAGKDKRTAELMLAEKQQQIRLEKLKAKSDVIKEIAEVSSPRTFRQAAEDYMKERQGTDFKHSTRLQYDSILRCHLLPAFADSPLNDISQSTLKQFQAKLSQFMSARRLNTIMIFFRGILRQEFHQGTIVGRDPTLGARCAQETKTEINPLSEAELEKVLNAIDPHYKPLFEALAFTGARPNELIALRWTDIDWDKHEIDIRKGRVKGREALPKTGASQRRIQMPSRLEASLQAMKDDPNRVASVDGYVFVNKLGRPASHLDRIWNRALKDADLKARPSYQLRHTFATLCILKGFPLPYIAKALGHSTISTLIQHYAGWIDAATQDNNERLRSAFDAKKTATTGRALTIA